MTEPTDPAEPADSDEQTPAPPAKRGKGAVTGIVAAVLIFVCCIWGYAKDSDEDDGPTSYDAKVMCQEFVGRVLKAPSTARYSDEVVTVSSGTWTVTGHVDAQNSFGAMIRSSYTCKMTVSGDTWRLVVPVSVV